MMARMRHSTVSQVKKYLLLAWVIGSIEFVLIFFATHGSLVRSDYLLILTVILTAGGTIFVLFDALLIDEEYKAKKRDSQPR